MVATATKPKPGLGKGLSALLGESYSQTASTIPGVTAGKGESQPHLNLDAIHSGKFQPRTRFSEAQLAELTESIRKNGIMQPIVVRPSASQPSMYEIIAGERRWRAAKMAGLDAVPVIVRDISDQQALELALVENVQRHDLSPLEEAVGYQRLIEDFGYTQEALAETIGKSRSHIANLLRLLGLPEEIKRMLDEGILTMGHARALIGAPKPVLLARAVAKRGLSVRQTEQLVRRLSEPEGTTSKRGGAKVAKDPNKDADIAALEESLSASLGLTVRITDKGQGGEILISYQSLNELDTVLRRLGGAPV